MRNTTDETPPEEEGRANSLTSENAERKENRAPDEAAPSRQQVPSQGLTGAGGGMPLQQPKSNTFNKTIGAFGGTIIGAILGFGLFGMLGGLMLGVFLPSIMKRMGRLVDKISSKLGRFLLKMISKKVKKIRKNHRENKEAKNNRRTLQKREKILQVARGNESGVTPRRQPLTKGDLRGMSKASNENMRRSKSLPPISRKPTLPRRPLPRRRSI